MVYYLHHTLYYNIHNCNIGRCYRIHGKNSKRCDNNGYFRPRFCCQLSLRSRKRCVCINPRNGTEIPNTNVILQTSDARQTHQCTDAGSY